MKAKFRWCSRVVLIVGLLIQAQQGLAQSLQQQFQQREIEKSSAAVKEGEKLLKELANLVERFRYVSSRTRGFYNVGALPANSGCSGIGGGYRIAEGIVFESDSVRVESGVVGYVPTFFALGRLQDNVLKISNWRGQVLDSYELDTGNGYSPRLDIVSRVINTPQCSLEIHFDKDILFYRNEKTGQVGKLELNYFRDDERNTRDKLRDLAKLKAQLIVAYPMLRSRIEEILKGY
jgi:hypothetical protein